MDTTVGPALDRGAILAEVVRILEHMTSDWDLELSGGIGPASRVVDDLGFESLDVVQFVVAIQEAFRRRDLPFEELLMVHGRYVDDLQVSHVVDFLLPHLSAAEAARGSTVNAWATTPRQELA
jgi:acyl carrier protein